MPASNLYTHRDSNIQKTWFLLTTFLIIVIAVGWVFSQALGDPSILIIAVIFSVVMSWTSYWYSDKIVLKMTRATPVDMKNNPELYRIVENLAITAGLPMPGLYLVPEEAPNAFATGRDPEHAVVAVTEGLLKRLDRSELEGVLAHELSHVGNRDILVSTMAVVLVGVLSMAADFFLRRLWWGGRSQNSRGGGVMMLIGIIFAILAPIAGKIMQLAVSRKREFLADASGALLTRYPDALASALRKISADPTPMKKAANNTTAHLWLDDPYKGKDKKNWLHKMFMTHPPIEERIAALQGIRENNET